MTWIRRNKFKNQKTQWAGHWHDSKAEAALHTLLSLRERGGEIRDLAHHPGTVFLTDARVQYRPDFRWTNAATGETEYGEFKGFETPEWRIKRRLWSVYGPGKLYIWRGSVSRLTLDEVITPKNSQSDVDEPETPR